MQKAFAQTFLKLCWQQEAAIGVEEADLLILIQTLQKKVNLPSYFGLVCKLSFISFYNFFQARPQAGGKLSGIHGNTKYTAATMRCVEEFSKQVSDQNLRIKYILTIPCSTFAWIVTNLIYAVIEKNRCINNERCAGEWDELFDEILLKVHWSCQKN